MSSIRVPGSAYRRASGRWAGSTPPVFDSETGRRRRINLGTFDTRELAVTALAEFSADRSQRRADVERQSLGDYLTGWLELIQSQVEVGGT